MKSITLNNNKYDLIENYKNSFNLEETESLFTEYFNEFDYVLGDYSYNKLRLKGYFEKNSKKVKKYNDITEYKKYINDFCAVDCGYFLLKKSK